MRVTTAIDFNDDERRLINAHYGRDGLATRETIQNWMAGAVQTELAELEREHEKQDAQP